MCNTSILTIFNNNTMLGIQDIDGDINPLIRKNNMIQQLMNYYQIHDKLEVLFIDDNINNINAAKHENYNCLWINNDNRDMLGINDKDLNVLGVYITQKQDTEDKICWFCNYNIGKYITGLGHLCELCKTKMDSLQMY